VAQQAAAFVDADSQGGRRVGGDYAWWESEVSNMARVAAVAGAVVKTVGWRGGGGGKVQGQSFGIYDCHCVRGCWCVLYFVETGL